ncbi:hypothetical protein ACG2LH_15775 [Zhouia sp. PK063]|uniref:hypothetical protein n=1 Tax=Zhouia sp. PK063 TaxID=3373602 RepID=UPI00378D1C6C
MKYIFTLSLLILCNLCYSQHYFKIDSSGYHFGEDNSVIVDINNKSAKEIYNKVLDYIYKNYDTPDKVIKSKIEDSYIRFEFYDLKIASTKSTKWNPTGTNIGCKTKLTIDVKDNKIRFKDLSTILLTNPLKLNEEILHIQHVPLNFNCMYDKKNRLTKRMKKSNIKEQIENYYDNLINKIIAHINNKNEKW